MVLALILSRALLLFLLHTSLDLDNFGSLRARLVPAFTRSHASVFHSLSRFINVNSHLEGGSKVDPSFSIGSQLVYLLHVRLNLLLLASELGQLDFVGINRSGGEVNEAGSLGSGTTVHGEIIKEAVIIADLS